MARLPLKIRRLLGELGNKRLSSKAVSACKRIYRDFIATRFDKMSKPGSRWRALAKSTLSARKRRGNSKRDKLFDTGELRRNLKSMIEITDSNSQEGCRLAIGFGGRSKKHSKWICQNGKYRLVQGSVTNQQIANWQNSGTKTIPQRKILVRPDVPTTAEMIEAIRKIIMDDLNG